MSKVMQLPSNRQTGAPVINIQSTHRTSYDLCNKVSFTVIFGSNGIIHIQSGMYIYTYSSQYRDAGWAKEIFRKTGTAVNAACHRFVSHICHQLRTYVPHRRSVMEVRA